MYDPTTAFGGAFRKFLAAQEGMLACTHRPTEDRSLPTSELVAAPVAHVAAFLATLQAALSLSPSLYRVAILPYYEVLLAFI